VITTSGATRERLLHLLAGGPMPPVVVAQPGIGRMRPTAASPDGKRIRCVAAVIPGKGQDVLLEALARVRDLDWRCELVGATDIHPGFVRLLRDRALRLGIADRVVLTGAWPPDPVSRLYEGCDLLVLPSRVEGYGMVIAEAVGCGVPVITSDTGGTREALGGLRSARPGLLVRPGDPGDLARALRAWLSSRGLRLDLAAAARARSSHRRTWAMTARAIAGALEGAATPVGDDDRVRH
jgi:glycosyltransferase involved in cell wall biosynthesis